MDLSGPAAEWRGPTRWLIVIGALALLAIAVGTAFTVKSFQERALDNSKRELENTVLLLARHFDQQLQDLQRVHKGLTAHLYANGATTPEAFRAVMRTYEAHLLLRSKVNDDFSNELMVADADGHVLNATEAWPPRDLDINEGEYFKAMKMQPLTVDEEFVQPVLSRFSNVWRTLFARRISGPKGEFLGVVTSSVESSQFEKFFASLSLGDNSSIAMFHRDGTLLARFPQSTSALGRKHNGPLLEHLRFSNDPATMRVKSPIDGVDRLGTVRLLRDFPIALVATTTIDSVLADWYSQTRFLVGVAGLLALMVAGLLYLVIRHIQRQNRAVQAQMLVEKNRLDIAVNNMTQGLLLFDAQTRVVVCNQRYLDMYGLSRDVIKPGCSFRNVILHRKETGSFAGDVDRYVETHLSQVDRATVMVVEVADGRSIQISSRPVADGGWVATHEDITERRKAEAKIAHLAHYDALTDLPNRVLFRSELERELKMVERGAQCAVLYIDIDEFKSINDSLGHPVGDDLLKGIAERLRSCVRETDIVARLGGDEFAIVQVGIHGEDDVTDLVRRIYETIRQPFECLDHSLLTDASIGIAMAPRDGTDLDQLLRNADLAMYGAKSGGRRTHQFFEPQMDARVKARRAIEFDLRHAAGDGGFAAGGFEVHYQPILGLRDDRVVGCEALLRWHHPAQGSISPAEFIPLAEDIGIIDQLGEWVLNAACAEAAGWPGDVRIAVNVSPIQFRSQTLLLKVASALATSGLPAHRLELEITEAVLIRDDETALHILHGLRGLGVRIALDDFGTGYSSLSYLQRFPFDKIKIDRCFVNELGEPQGSASIVQAVVNIASARNMTTTAEGVETPRQRELLQTLDCTEMQGFLFSAAKPAADIRALLAGPNNRAGFAA